MKIRIVAMLVGLAVTSPATAQFIDSFGPGRGGLPSPTAPSTFWKVEVVPMEGEPIAGTIGLDQVHVEYELGMLEVATAKVRAIRPTAGQTAGQQIMHAGFLGVPGEIVTTTGETIKGMIYLPRLAMEIDLGTLQLYIEKIKELKFLEKATRPHQAEPAKEAEPAAEPANDQARVPSPIPRSLTRPR